MKEIHIFSNEVKTFFSEWRCPHCDGNMTSTGGTFANEHEHKCNKCGHLDSTSNKYPALTYRLYKDGQWQIVAEVPVAVPTQKHTQKQIPEGYYQLTLGIKSLQTPGIRSSSFIVKGVPSNVKPGDFFQNDETRIIVQRHPYFNDGWYCEVAYATYDPHAWIPPEYFSPEGGRKDGLALPFNAWRHSGSAYSIS